MDISTTTNHVARFFWRFIRELLKQVFFTFCALIVVFFLATTRCAAWIDEIKEDTQEAAER